MVRSTLRARAMIVTALLGALFAPATKAADMAFPVAAPPIEEGPVEWGSNWYLRGQIGAASQNIPYMDGMRLQTSWPSNWTIGLGGGYKFNNWFRTDITIDYQKLWSKNGTYGPMPCLTAAAIIAACAPTVNNIDESISFLANAYLDLGNWWGFTPYIGAGGGANVFVERHNVTWSPALWPYDVTTTRSGDHVTFAYAGMAGVAYDIDRHWTVDLGYRFVNLGRVEGYNIYNHFLSRDLLSQQVRLGFRYMID
jgi:opacity protein-like surface antigen